MPAGNLRCDDDRDAVIKILWEDPIARVRCHEVPLRLKKGDEYLDLQHLDAGVQRVLGPMSPTGGELPRSAVTEATWKRLLACLSAASSRPVVPR